LNEGGDEVKRLCYGTFVTVLDLCISSGVTKLKLYEALLASVDEVGLAHDPAQATRWMKCQINLSAGLIDTMRTVAVSEYAIRFSEKVMYLLNPNKTKTAVSAIWTIIAEDECIDRETIIDLVGGIKKKDRLSKAMSDPANYLAGVFRYAVLYAENREGKDCLAQINEHFIAKHESGMPSTPPPNNLRSYTEHFYGREDKLREISEKFEQSESVTLKQTLSGLGGVGKTQLVLKYAHEYAHEYRDGICWLDAENEDALLSSCLEFCKKIGIIYEEMVMVEDVNNFRTVFLGWLADKHDWLLIFDNADDDMLVRNYMPSKINGHVLTTTRRQDWFLGEAIDVEVFSPEDAVAFLLERTRRKDRLEAQRGVGELAERLGCLPLALEQAGAYMDVSGESFEGYLITLDEEGLEPFRIEIGKPTFYKQIITTTWQVAFKAINNQAAEQLFYICAYMDAAKIPVDVFVEFRSELPDQLSDALSLRTKRDGVIAELRKYSLIERDVTNSDFINIHRLVQEVVRDKLGNIENQPFLEYCLILLVSAIPFEYNARRLHELFLRIGTHATAAAEHLFRENCNNAGKQKEAVELFRLIGNGYLETARYSQAISAYKRGLKIAENLFDKSHETVVSMYNQVAITNEYNGDFDKALKWYRKTRVFLEETHGGKHSYVLTVQSNIATIYSRKGNYKKALKELHKILDLFKEKEDSENLDIANIYSKIASTYLDVGDYDAAIKRYDKALVIREKFLDDNHIEVAANCNNLGQVYYKKSEYGKALKLYARALEICENILDKNHHYIASTNNNIALVYHKQGNYDAALEQFNIALTTCEEFLGKGHPSTLKTYNNIALVYDDLGHYDEAMDWHNKALTATEARFGKSHPQTATAYNNIAGIHDKKGEHSEAIELYKRALSIRKSLLGVEHPDIAVTYNNLALAYEHDGKHDMAMELYQTAVNSKEATLGKNHPSTAIAYNNIAGMYDRNKEFDEAIRYYNKALNIYKDVFGENHENTAKTYNNIGLALAKQGHPEQALELYSKALNIYQEVLDDEHPTIAIICTNIGYLYYNQEQYNEAFDFLQKALNIRLDRLGDNHLETAKSRKDVAEIYYLAQHYEKVLELCLPSYKVFLGRFSCDHRTTISTRELMESAYNKIETTESFYIWLEGQLIDLGV